MNAPILVAAMICNGCNERHSRHFDTLAAASQERMVEKGWLPTFISPDATDIDVDGDLDSASVYGSYQSGDASSLRKHCAPADDSSRVPGYGPKWFGDDVKAAGTAGRLRLKGYEVLRCEDGFHVAVLGSRRFVSFWSSRYGH